MPKIKKEVGVEKPKKKRRRTSAKTVDILVENFVSLQKVMVEMSLKIENLSEQIKDLLDLFEKSARTFSEKEGARIAPEDKEFLDKLDRLIELNKSKIGKTGLSKTKSWPQT